MRFISCAPLLALFTAPTLAQAPVRVSGPWAMNCSEVISSLGPQGASVLKIGANTLCGAFETGAGRAVLFGDEEWCGTGVESGCASGQLPDLDRQVFFDNALAWLIPAVGFQYVSGRSCSLGSNYCMGAPNSVGSGATLTMTGSTTHGANDLALVVEGAPPANFGAFFYGSNQIELPLGDGFRCVAAPVYLLGPPQSADATGMATRLLDLNSPPASGGSGQITLCSTWNFQYMYRDPGAVGGAGFNLSDGYEITFIP